MKVVCTFLATLEDSPKLILPTAVAVTAFSSCTPAEHPTWFSAFTLKLHFCPSSRPFAVKLQVIPSTFPTTTNLLLSPVDISTMYPSIGVLNCFLCGKPLQWYRTLICLHYMKVLRAGRFGWRRYGRKQEAFFPELNASVNSHHLLVFTTMYFLGSYCNNNSLLATLIILHTEKKLL